MSRLLEKQLQLLPSDYVTFGDLKALLKVNDNALYAQVKRALKEGHLTRLKKEIYRRGGYLEKAKPHPFEMAHAIFWPSYISLESALSFHGLIPEAVFNTTCVTTKKTTTVKNKFGVFMYRKVPSIHFFLGVSREVENDVIFFIATPWKAIADYIYCYKKNWVDKTPLEESLRIDLNDLPPLNVEFAKALSTFYHSKRIDRFLEGMMRGN
jgi:predicted transcriptional regulator of viral defense system